MRLIGTRLVLAGVAAAFASCLPAAGAGPPQLGKLPDGALSHFEVSDVRTEICRTHVFPTDAMPAGMPAGYRLAKLSERASVPAVAELLKERPELRDHARGSFCFIDAGVHKIDGIDLYPGRRSKTAFLWADVIAEGDPPDSRQVGTRRRAQFFWFYDDRGIDKALARRVIPNALFGRIEIEKAGDSWVASLATDGGELSAKLTPSTARRRLVHPLPAFETVPLLADARDHFMVVTYAGHHEQRAVGEWHATGSAPWVRTITHSVAGRDASFIQDGFSVDIGLYKGAGNAPAVTGRN